MSNVKQTNVQQMITDLGGGTFEAQLGHLISDVALGTALHGGQKKGKVVITLDFERQGDSDQVLITHTIAHKTPTAKGSRSEDTQGKTPMYTDWAGRVTLFAMTTDDIFGKKKHTRDGKSAEADDAQSLPN